MPLSQLVIKPSQERYERDLRADWYGDGGASMGVFALVVAGLSVVGAVVTASLGFR